MDQKKLKRLFGVLVAAMLCLTLVFALFACVPDDDDPSNLPTDTALIKNGTFERTTSDVYPKVPTSWTGSQGLSGGTNATPTSADSLSAGVINVSERIYNDNRRKWENLDNPGKYSSEADDYMLMINNKVDNAYKYSISGVKAEMGKYYVITFHVKTVNVTGRGATIYLKSDAYSQFVNIDTKGEWQEYKIYLESSIIKDSSFNIELSLGEGGMKDGKLASGYAFFDNLLMEEISEKGKETFDSISKGSNVTKYSMRLPDADFDYTSGSSYPYSPYGYTGVAGTNTLSGTSTINKGIVDTSRTGDNWLTTQIKDSQTDEKFPVNNPGVPDAIGNTGSNVLYIASINDTNLSTYGYRSKAQIRFPFGDYYKLTVRVYTHIINGDGAYIKLTQGSDDKDTPYQVKSIDTNQSWQDVTFYVKGNEIRNRDFYLEMWLGGGGSKEEESQLSRGYVFFDYITLQQTNAEEYDAAAPTSPSGYSMQIDLSTNEQDLFKGGDFTQLNQYWNTTTEYVGSDDKTVHSAGITEVNSLDINNWPSQGAFSNIANPLSPHSSITNILGINHTQPTVSQVIYEHKIFRTNENYPLSIKPNKTYRLAMWVKTVNVPETSGLTVNLTIADKDGKKTTVKAITAFNSASNKAVTELYNGYVEMVFYIEGSDLASKIYTDDIKELGLEFVFGSGTQADASKYAYGSAFIANVNMVEVAYNEYNNASTSSGLTVKQSYTSSTGSITNGSFNQIDKTDIEFSDEGYAKELAAPKSWTKTSDKDNNFRYGVVNWNDSAMLSKLGLNKDTLYDGFGLDPNQDAFKFAGAPNLLYLGARNDNVSVKPESSQLLKENAQNENFACGCACQSCKSQAADENGYVTCDGSKCNDNCQCTHSVWLRENYDGTENPFGFTSNRFTLTSAGYYKVSVWVKAVNGKATVTLGSTATNASVYRFDIDSANNSGWDLYDFYIKVGMSDVTLEMKLILGEYLTDGSVSQDDYVLFDSAQRVTITEEEYEAAQNARTSNNIIITFETDGFETSPSDSDTLPTPGGWSGSAINSNANTGSEYIKSGVITRNNTVYTDWLQGALSDEEFAEYLNKIFNGVNDVVIDSKLDIKENFLSGDSVLCIDALQATTYQYKTSTKTFTKQKYYEVSVWVMTDALSESGKGAYITLGVNKKTYTFDDIDTNGTWKKYSFFVYAEKDLSSVTLSLGIGGKNSDDYSTGRAFFDNATIREVDETLYNSRVPVDEVKDEDGKVTETTNKFDETYNRRLYFDADMVADTNTDDPTEEPTNPTNSLGWLEISSIVIGVILIIVLLVFGFRFLNKHKKSTAQKPKILKKLPKKEKQEEDKLDNEKLDDFKD